jgi:hypothetical protein
MNKNLKLMALMCLGAVAVGAQAAITIGASNVAFVDISSTGTGITGIGDDTEHTLSGTVLQSAGWNGNALLGQFRSIRIGNNGGVIIGNSATDTFASADQVGYTNGAIAGLAASNGGQFGNGGLGPRSVIFPHWDDTTPLAGSSSLRWQVITGDLYIQWTGQDHFSATGTGTITYQMVMRKSGSSTIADFVYEDTVFGTGATQNDGGSATIGFKNWGVNPFANDVEFGTTDVAKVGGWASAGNANLPKSVSIVPEPASFAALGLGLAFVMRRKKK